MKLPAFQFYPADWRKSSDVQAMSFHDRGVWFEILCLMHESEDRGRLLLAGKPISDEILAKLLRISLKKLKNSIEIFLEFGVAFRDETGALCNRRMIRDEQIRRVRAEAGKKGGNPLLLNQTDNQNGKQNPTPSSSSSFASSTSSTKKKEKKKAAAPTDAEWLKEISETEAYRNLPVLKEFDKARIWANTNGKQCTRRFFIAWLNRIQPMKVETNGHKPFDVGKPQAIETQFTCKKCLDTGEVTQKPRNAKYDWELEALPCPDCKLEKAA